MAFSWCVASLWIISMSSNRFPLSAIFNFGNIQKSQGAISGLYEGCRSCTILCFAKNCCTRFDECAGALSWWRSQSPHTRELFLQILFKISQTVVFSISRSFSSSRTVNRRSPSIASRTCSILSNVFVVEGRPERESLSTEVRPPLKRLYYSFIRVLLIHSFPKAFCIIWIVPELIFPSWKQNLMQIRWSCFSVFFNNPKIRRTQK